MQPNRTYSGLRDVYLSADGMREQAAVLAAMNVRRGKTTFPKIGGEKKIFASVCRGIERELLSGRELSRAMELFYDDFYIAEKAIIQLENSQYKRLPVMAEGTFAGLPRVYAISLSIVGHRDGRVDEGILEKYLGSFQQRTPLSMAELWALPDMLRTALIKLICIESAGGMERIRQCAAAEDATDQLLKAKDRGRRAVVLEKLALPGRMAFTERLCSLLLERDGQEVIREIGQKLGVGDMDLECICVSCREDENLSQMRMGNALRSLSTLDATDYQSAFEKYSRVHEELMRDQTYPQMDEKSRAYYRDCVERISTRLSVAEPVAARQAAELALGREGKRGEAGYYLYLEGMEELFTRLRPDRRFAIRKDGEKLAGFLFLQAAIAALLIYFAAWGGAADLILALFPAWSIGAVISVRLYLRAASPHMIPRLKLEDGVPLTIVTIPVLLIGEREIRDAVTQMENHFLASRTGNCLYTLLGDFPDSDAEERSEEAGLLRLGKKLVRALNEKYSQGGEDLFFYLHRKRVYNEHDKVYMGRERKRGALGDLVELLVSGQEEPFLLLSGKLPKGIRYCVTLDADTVMPPEALKKLIGAMVHPLSEPELEGGVVKRGYGIISPRMSPLPSGAAKSRFARLFSGDCGMGTYFPVSGEFYQDVFGTGLFGGKGIFSVKAFHEAGMPWIPDNTVLSHDMLEGCFLRAGFAGDVVLYDSEPSSFLSWWKRQHRWARGDWQLVPFLFQGIKVADGSIRSNPLSLLSRYKILDNLRRSLLPGAILYAFVLVPLTGIGWHFYLSLFALLEGLGPDLLTLPFQMAFSKNKNPLGMLVDRGIPLYRVLIEAMTLPFSALAHSSARNLSLYRMLITRRKMLQWQTAAQAAKKPKSILSYYRALYSQVIYGGIMVFLLFIVRRPAYAAIFAALWLAAPAVVMVLDRKKREYRLNREQEELLLEIANRTWKFFEEFSNEKSSFLPPDNFQEFPYRPPVPNTSPTNIGMGYMACLCAHDLELIDGKEMCARMERMTDAVERMEKWNGHLYNWYRTDSLCVLRPAYVSSVDSGNFAACLLCAAEGLIELDMPEGERLAQRLRSLVGAMDFDALYDRSRKLFYIGFDPESDSLSKAWYDLLASEARTTGLVATALGQAKGNWFSLSRMMVPVSGRTLVSWGGTMFEYLMPALFTGMVPYTLLWESCRGAVRAQMQGGGLWGVSESGYYAFDRAMYYQYRAFGIPKLSLTARQKERVISPYSTLLALMIFRQAALDNLTSLCKHGALGEYGMYEALDFHKPRVQEGREYEMVQSYMAHHQGMGLCALTNVLKDNVLVKRFLSVPEVRAVKVLLEEKPPQRAILIRELQHSGNGEKKRTMRHAKPRRILGQYKVPETQLLSNGSYTVFVTDSGKGFSKRGDIMLTRFRPDLAQDSGIHILLRHGSEVMDVCEGGECILHIYKAEFLQRMGFISCKTEICVSARHEAELRSVTVTNHAQEAQTLELGAFFDVCLTDQADDLSSGITKLTIEAKEENGVLYFKKRPKPGEEERCLFLQLTGATPRYLSDRLSAQGRGRSLKEAMLQPVGGEVKAAPIDPFAAARSVFMLNPGETAVLNVIVGYANGLKRAAAVAEEAASERADCFDLAWAHAASALRMEKVDEGKAELFERIIARIALGIPEKPRDGKKDSIGIRGIWELGISGDDPITLISVGYLTELRMARTTVAVQAYAAARGIKNDLVILGTYPNEYRNEMRTRLFEMAASRPGVHLINRYDINAAQEALLFAAATVVMDTSVSPDRQFMPQRVQEKAQLTPSHREELILQEEKLLFDNGLGGFRQNGEYVIMLGKGECTPLPWSNIMANDKFGTLVTESGGGYTWYQNSRENKLTPWRHAPITDPPSEMLYLEDVEDGTLWSVAAGKFQGGAVKVCHGYGYTRFTTGAEGLLSELTVFADAEESKKYLLLCVKNSMLRKRRLKATYALQWVLGDFPHPESVYTWEEDGRLCADNLRYCSEDGYAFLECSEEAESTSERGEKALQGEPGLAFSETHGLGSATSALRAELELRPGETKKIAFSLGWALEDEYKPLKVEWVEERLEQVQVVWKKRLGCIQVHTPNASMDMLLNGRLSYQTWASRILSRTAYYQCGGAIGFRDQLQDMLSIMHADSGRARAHILLCAQRQFKAGDVLHWWHEPIRGVRTRVQDDKLFLPYVTTEYVQITGDVGIWEEQVPYLKDREIPEGKKDLYEHMELSNKKESLYQHCTRAIDSIKLGSHGLPLMQGGDWNDGMELVGKDGGESVWLGWFYLKVLERFDAAMPNERNYKEQIGALKKALEEAWDGAWYRRAYFGDGTPLGSRGNTQCAIDCISQCWAAICGGEKAAEAMDAVAGMLLDEQNGILKLLSPPFSDEQETHPVGYISAYLPGVRENGGQYSHAAAWAVLACCHLGRAAQAQRFFDLMNPIEHALTRTQTMKYKAEPYALAGDTYALENVGRGGWSWYTGAAAWLYKTGLEEMLGIKKRGDTLEISPCTIYESYTVEYRYKSTLYRIRLRREHGAEENKKKTILLTDDGLVHEVDLLYS